MMLSVEAIEAGYGGAKVLQGVDFDLDEGEALALIGRNGMGKTTTVRALFGLLPLKRAASCSKAARSAGAALRHRARGSGPRARGSPGIPDPDGRREPGRDRCDAPAGADAGRLTEVFRLFPRLAERRRHYGDQLSGGEQQMLAIGRALMTNPKLLVLDEATEGLAPLIRVEIWALPEAAQSGRGNRSSSSTRTSRLSSTSSIALR